MNIHHQTIKKLPLLLSLAVATIGIAGAATTKTPEIDVTNRAGTSLVDGMSGFYCGMTTVGTSTTRIIIIRNVGTAPLTGLAITKTGVSKNDFTISPLPVTSLAPGASIKVRITFAPSVMGRAAAAIHIKSNDANENPFDIRITGIGMGRA